MHPAFRAVRPLRAALTAGLLLLTASCGGGGGGRPDTGEVERQLLDNLKSQTEGQAHFAAFRETSCEKMHEFGDAEDWAVRFEGEIEFDGPCYYFGQERAKGDKVKFEATTSYLKDDSGAWHKEPNGIYQL
jgi:hypothetical protein